MARTRGSPGFFAFWKSTAAFWAADARNRRALAHLVAGMAVVGAIYYEEALLAMLRTSDRAGAEALYRQAADHGHPDALRYLAESREQAGDHLCAYQIRRFGLTDDGAPATSLD